MPKYILRSTDTLSAAARVPDMRGFSKGNLSAMADNLKRIWGLPEPVAERALLRVNDVVFTGGDVVIDDDAVVLYPQRQQPAICFNREVVEQPLAWVE